jgi:peptidoglycan DL-endopeptidase CwlO
MKRSIFVKRPLFIITALVLLSVGTLTKGFGVLAANCSSVSDCQAQINNLSAQNLSAQQAVSNLVNQASSYQDAVNKLEEQINGLQQQIVLNQQQSNKLQDEIDKNQVQLDQQKKTLGENIRQMYLEGDVSTLEMLASSKNISEFINKQTYRNAVQSQVKTTLDKITALQVELKQQQDQIKQLLATQQSQRDQLSADEDQQLTLLSYNAAQQSQFNQQISSNRAAINQLQAKIVALNTPAGSSFTYSGSCGGSYPATAGPGLWGSYWGCGYYKDNTIDNWGMYNRECVSYTAWMVHMQYVNGIIAHDMPNWGGVGNAYQWIADAQNAGIPVDQSPQDGDIAIRPASGINGDVGHAMYVRTASGGSIYVQQYNADLQGNYSEGWRSPAGLYFLHFSQWY